MLCQAVSDFFHCMSLPYLFILPENIFSIGFTSIFRKQLLFNDRFISLIVKEACRKSSHEQDESIHTFVTKRFGSKVCAQ